MTQCQHTRYTSVPELRHGHENDMMVDAFTYSMHPTLSAPFLPLFVSSICSPSSHYPSSLARGGLFLAVSPLARHTLVSVAVQAPMVLDEVLSRPERVQGLLRRFFDRLLSNSVLYGLAPTIQWFTVFPFERLVIFGKREQVFLDNVSSIYWS